MLTLQEVASGVPPTLDSLLARFAFAQLLDASAPPADAAEAPTAGSAAVATTQPQSHDPTPVFRGRATAALARLGELTLDDAFGSQGEVRTFAACMHSLRQAAHSPARAQNVLALTQWRHDSVVSPNELTVRYVRTVAAVLVEAARAGVVQNMSADDWSAVARVFTAARMPYAAMEVAVSAPPLYRHRLVAWHNVRRCPTVRSC